MASTLSSDDENFIDEVIRQVYNSNDSSSSFVLSDNIVFRLIRLTMQKLLQENQLIRVDIERNDTINICGDIHAQFPDLKNIFIELGHPSETNKFIFLGDYVDRGRFNLETICFLFAYKCKYDKSFILLRGNHEVMSVNYGYGFINECRKRFDNNNSKGTIVWKRFNDCFNALSVSAVIGNSILVMI